MSPRGVQKPLSKPFWLCCCRLKCFTCRSMLRCSGKPGITEMSQCLCFYVSENNGNAVLNFSISLCCYANILHVLLQYIPKEVRVVLWCMLNTPFILPCHFSTFVTWESILKQEGVWIARNLYNAVKKYLHSFWVVFIYLLRLLISGHQTIKIKDKVFIY